MPCDETRFSHSRRPKTALKVISITSSAEGRSVEVRMSRALALVLLATATARAQPFAPFGAPGHPVTREVQATSIETTAGAGGSNPFGLSWRVYRAVVGKFQGP